MMKAVTLAISKVILELQGLQKVSKFALGGGTNFELQFNHRMSNGIDFLSSEIIGNVGNEGLKISKTK